MHRKLEGHLMMKRAYGLLVATLLLPAFVLAQSTSPPTEFQTPWGDPDLQGLWDYRTMTPLQRPSELADKEVFTEEEAAAYQEAELEGRADYDALPTVHAKFWLDYGTELTPDRRTSLIIDPPDGRIPARTEGASTLARERAERRERTHSIQDRSITERCILGFNAGPPMNPGAYNNNLLLLQTPGMVVLHNEMVHEVRVVRLGDKAPLPDNLRQIRGDSRGYWDGPTLVVETTNFSNIANFQGSSAALHVVERFTRVDEETLHYEYTVTDPTTFVQPWSAAMPMARTEGPMFEFACHEGNYGLTNILSAARAEERRAR